jgi:hypothetical protein
LKNKKRLFSESSLSSSSPPFGSRSGPFNLLRLQENKNLSISSWVFIYSVFLSVYSTEVYTAFIWLEITLAINMKHFEAASFKEETVIPVEEIVKVPEQYPTDMTTI